MSRLLTAREAADYLNVAHDVLAQWRWRQKGPSYSRVGSRKIVYDIADLEAFVAAGRVETKSFATDRQHSAEQPTAN